MAESHDDGLLRNDFGWDIFKEHQRGRSKVPPLWFWQSEHIYGALADVETPPLV